MTIPAIARDCHERGLAAIAITDHLNRREELPLHDRIRAELLALDSPLRIWFGVELDFDGCDGDFALDAEAKERLGLQLVLAGIHAAYLEAYDLRRLVEIQHRHHLRICAHPLVDVLVHPYWFWGERFREMNWPWFDSMRAVPESFRRELGQAAKESGTAIEINARAIFANDEYSEAFRQEYEDYLRALAAAGVKFSIGSDAHDLADLKDVSLAWRVVERLGLGPEQLWQPEGAPLAAGKKR